MLECLLAFAVGVAPAFTALLAIPAALPDHGVYPSLDPQIEIALPAWLLNAPLRVRHDRTRHVLTVLSGVDAVKSYPVGPTCAAPTIACLGLRAADRTELAPLAQKDGTLPVTDDAAAIRDTDNDGIPDAVDILIGGKKTVILASPYVATTRKLPYPGGDVPTSEGVCTDVVVRALRNAGIDLQKEVFEDAGRVPRAYPSIRQRNPSIDHRRVRNLMVYFERHFRRLAPTETLLPGDVILLDTFPHREGIEHIGLVSDRAGRSGHPLIINAWTDGYKTSEMDLLEFVAAPAVYRIPSGATTSSPRGFQLPAEHRQVVVVVADSWTAPSARMSSWERAPAGRWVRRVDGLRANIGAVGLGWGRGLLPASVSTDHAGPMKREGDDRAPAGVFRLAGLTGYAKQAPASARMPYTTATSALRCVDDPRSPHYNQIVTQRAGETPSWTSDEAMRRDDEQYALTVIVDHNRNPTEPDAGSCIFLHAWPAKDKPSPGCTMLSGSDLARLVTWLDPAMSPVLVQLPRAVYDRVATAWDLPR